MSSEADHDQTRSFQVVRHSHSADVPRAKREGVDECRNGRLCTLVVTGNEELHRLPFGQNGTEGGVECLHHMGRSMDTNWLNPRERRACDASSTHAIR
ncbi:hypothetical protein [Rhodococcus sp. WWJCD1]|uniref:hypothetical protein n=1 Tax=Rhodococcus sp. WWJCD1 TaxID=2022519 RepID=UPI0020CCD13A|nr:hypothetical protein [Rhodococcus sp. WWJCD1]